ncbi:hypothetical protein SH501x_000342 [Pirellulaceae bacterium SH501]
MHRFKRAFIFASLLASVPFAPCGGAEDKNDTESTNETQDRIRFIPRTDEMAESDLEKLRFALSQAEDSRGPIDPLASYAKQPSQSSPKKKVDAEKKDNEKKDKKNDADAKQSPQLSSEQGGDYQSPRIAWESSVDLLRLSEQPKPLKAKNNSFESSPSAPTSRPTMVAKSDGFRSARFEQDADATQIPKLDDAVTYASANVPVVNGQDRTSRFQEIPFGSQGTPVAPIPGVGNPNLGATNPSIPGVYPPSGVYPPTGTYPPVGTYPPAGTYPPPMVYPPTMPTGPAVVAPTPTPTPAPYDPAASIVPGIVPPSTTPSPGVIIPAPPATYVPAPTGPAPGVPFVGVPTFPTYPTAAPIAYPPTVPVSNPPPQYAANESSYVTNEPFVSSPPRQIDARFMVSPTLFRPATDDCNTCGTAPRPYAPNPSMPSGTPMSYAPPTYYPYSNNGFNSGYRSLIGFGQNVSLAQVGRGLYGQPTAYMPNQPFRNFLRYLFP